MTQAVESRHAFVPLDERIVDGSFYLVRTGDGFLHAAARFAGEWRYSRRGMAVAGTVEAYVWSPPEIAGAVQLAAAASGGTGR